MPHTYKHDQAGSGFSVDHDMAGYNSGSATATPAAPRTPQQQGHRFIGLSPVMQVLYTQIEQAAKSQAPVFIIGETGTGKELCAEAIHRHSPRAHQPFIAINCAAIPRDLLESELFGHVKGAFTGAISDREGAAAMAHKGTLFLDEVAEMAPDMQTKLLRFLQNFSFRKIGGNTLEQTDVRIICATNRDPLKEIAAGHLREDLFFRLHVIPLEMPPPVYAGGADDAVLPGWLSAMTLADVERFVIESTVTRMRGNVPQAAAHLGVAPSTLYRKRISWNPALAREDMGSEMAANPDLLGN